MSATLTAKGLKCGPIHISFRKSDRNLEFLNFCENRQFRHDVCLLFLSNQNKFYMVYYSIISVERHLVDILGVDLLKLSEIYTKYQFKKEERNYFNTSTR